MCWLERIYTKMSTQRMSKLFNEIYIYIYISWNQTFCNIFIRWVTIQQLCMLLQGDLIFSEYCSSDLSSWLGALHQVVCFGFGLVLWHVKHCRSFNTKYSYIYINYMISKHIFGITFLNIPDFIVFSCTQFYTIQFSITTQCKCQTVRFDQYIALYQV